MSKTLSKVYVIVAWNKEGTPSNMWAVPTHEQAESDIHNYFDGGDFTYTIEELDFYSAPWIYRLMED